MMWDKDFWKDAGERAVSTTAQTAVVLIGADFTGIIDVPALPWLAIAGTAGLAGAVSLLKSLAAGRNDGDASLVRVDHHHGGDHEGAPYTEE